MTSTTSTDSTTIAFGTFSAVTVDNSRVIISPELESDFVGTLGFFSNHSNRHQLSVTLADEQAAKLFARQIRQFAGDHELSANPTRNACVVTWRFTKPSVPSQNGPVEISNVADAADASKAGADAASDAATAAALSVVK